MVEIRRLLIKLCRENHITILISSHNLPELYQTVTDYIIIHEGRVVKTLNQEELEEKSSGKSGNQDPEVENPAGKAAEDCRGMETATWEKVADSMIYDLYLRENLKSHPSFEYDQKPYEKAVWEYRRQEKVPKTAHIEVFRDGKILLFDYENRDPLLHNAAVKEIQI